MVGTVRTVLTATLAATVAAALVVATALHAQADVIEQITESTSQAARAETSSGATLKTVTSPVRDGSRAFRHEVTNAGERSELRGERTSIGGTYWYGWSLFVPEALQVDGGKPGEFTIVNQFAAYPSVNRFDCGGDGSKLQLIKPSGGPPDGVLGFDLQAADGQGGSDCRQYRLADVADLRGRWTDFVMHVRWTGDTTGFLDLWMRIGGDSGSWERAVDFNGRTFWNDEDTGPYFKMGAYTGDPGNGSRVLYTDEYRLGDAGSSADEVAPGGDGPGGGAAPSPTPTSTSSPPGGQLSVSSVEASSDDGNGPDRTRDDDLSTRWSAQGDGQWIAYDLGQTRTVTELSVAWYRGDQRRYDFDVQTSSDGSSWTTVVDGARSSGTSKAQQRVDIPDTAARWVRIVGYGNSANDWNAITEVDLFGS